MINPDGGRKYSLRRPTAAADESANGEALSLSKEKKTTKLSFDDYFTQWSGLATTKPVPKAVNTCKNGDNNVFETTSILA